jgi:SHS2 domain-containing protein
MKSFNFIPHTADVRLLIKGSSYQDLFEAGLEGMAELLGLQKTHRSSKNLITKNVIIQAPQVTILLIDFLSHVLTQSYLEHVLFYKVVFNQLTKQNLEAVIYGINVSSFKEDIKAVTYHEANVKKNEKGFSTLVVFDI